MLSLISDLKDFNIPTILVVLGAISILLALGVKGGIELDRG